MTTIDRADGTSSTIAREHHTDGGPIRFAAHVVEMLVVMTLGMTLGGPLGIPDVASVELRAVMWLLAMTIPMVAWMSLRGMSARSAIEMSAAMALPTLVLLPIFWAGFVSGPALICLEHTLMTPAMVALMVVRRGDYGWAA